MKMSTIRDMLEMILDEHDQGTLVEIGVALDMLAKVAREHEHIVATRKYVHAAAKASKRRKG